MLFRWQAAHVLSSKDPLSGRLWTSIASVYPRKLAFDLASMLINASSGIQLGSLFRFNGILP